MRSARVNALEGAAPFRAIGGAGCENVQGFSPHLDCQVLRWQPKFRRGGCALVRLVIGKVAWPQPDAVGDL